MDKKIDEILVRKVAKLSRLDLSDAEVGEFTRQLSAILEYVEKMNQLDTKDVQPLAHCLPISNCFREDVVKESLGTDKVLAMHRTGTGISLRCRRFWKNHKHLWI